jgi:gluconolactonase
VPLRPVPLSEIQKLGEGLSRPDGIVAGRDGRVWATDRGAAVALVRPDGFKRMGGPVGAASGLAIDKLGRILIANFGVETDGAGLLQRFDTATGKVETVADAVEGRALTASSFPVVAADGTVYCSHSTFVKPMGAIAPDTAKDGLVFRVSSTGKTDIVARDLHFAKGSCFDAGEKNLYVVQGFAGTILRYGRRRDGTLDPPKPYGPRLGTVPQEKLTPDALAAMSVRDRNKIGFGEGCCFDAEGNLWVALVYANRIVAITPNFSISVIINDPEGQIVNMPTSLAFGGADMRDLYIGMRGADHIAKVRCPLPGLPLSHQR